MDWFQVVSYHMLVCCENGSKHLSSIKGSVLTNWATVSFSRTVFHRVNYYCTEHESLH